jgi:hypothetical protein
VTEPRGLVVVRLGNDHRINPWLVAPEDLRHWDLALSLYDDVELPESCTAKIIHRATGGKWDGLSRLFSEHHDLIFRYDYFWLVDDDIEASVGDVSALFDYVRTHGFDLAQPSLLPESYYSHRLTLHCPGFAHRHTNFVELMAPMLSRHLLSGALPLFAGTRSGHGIDWMWQRLARDPRQTVAIVDAISVGHYRPLRRHLAARLNASGIDPLSERERLVREWAVNREHAFAFAGRLASGKQIRSRFLLTLLMVRGYWRLRRRVNRPAWRLRNFVVFTMKHLFYKSGWTRQSRRARTR